MSEKVSYMNIYNYRHLDRKHSKTYLRESYHQHIPIL